MYKFILLLAAAITFSFCANQDSTKTETTIYFTRHAEKAKEGGKDPILTTAGEARANKLLELLKNEKVAAVYSTDFQRTIMTAQPTADHFKLETKIYDHRNIDIKKVAMENKGKTVLVVGHSNSTPTLVNSLLGKDEFDQIDESDYTNLFRVSMRNDKKEVERMKY